MRSDDIKLREFEAFEAYMRLGTAQAAAAEMGITQPMVSRLLNNLEEKIGLRLFESSRNTKNVTPEAQLFYTSVARGLVGIQQIRDEAAAIANKQKGNIVVVAQPVYCDTFLLDAVASFKKKHPQVGVRLVDSGMVDMMSMINDRGCDIGIGITLDASMQEVVVNPLARCEARCIVPADHALAGEDEIPLQRIAREAFVELPSGAPMRTHVDSLMQRMGGNRYVAAEMRHLRGICALVERGVGIAITDPVATLLIDQQRAVPKILAPSIGWDMALFLPRGRPLSAVALAFCEEVYEQVGLLRSAGLVT
jgi:DNA-binding transcriptional LysR family regulator